MFIVSPLLDTNRTATPPAVVHASAAHVRALLASLLLSWPPTTAQRVMAHFALQMQYDPVRVGADPSILAIQARDLLAVQGGP